jgi:hypothetical protein
MSSVCSVPLPRQGIKAQFLNFHRQGYDTASPRKTRSNNLFELDFNNQLIDEVRIESK